MYVLSFEQLRLRLGAFRVLDGSIQRTRATELTQTRIGALIERDGETMDDASPIAEGNLAIVASLSRELRDARRQIDNLTLRNVADASMIDAQQTALSSLQARLDEIDNSLAWFLARKVPVPLARFVRRSAKLTWWTLSLRLIKEIRRRSSLSLDGKGFDSELFNAATSFPNFNPHTLALAEQKLSKFDAFDPEQYFVMHGDIRGTGVTAAWHAVRYGAQEGRALFRDEAVARAVGAIDQLVPKASSSPLRFLSESVYPLQVYCSSLASGPVRMIARELVADLAIMGIAAQLLDETTPPEASASDKLIIAPHEFFFLGSGACWLREDILAQAYLLNTEPVQTPGFSRALPYLLMARGVVGLSSQTTRLLQRAGVDATSYEPSLVVKPQSITDEDREHPLFKTLPRRVKEIADLLAPWKERALEVSFIGESSPARERFFARHAACFAAYEAFIYCRHRRVAWSSLDGDEVLRRLRTHIFAHSKVVLNIGADEFGDGFPSDIARATLHGRAVLISDREIDAYGVEAGKNYFLENKRHMPDLCEWLLKTREGEEAANQILQANDEICHRKMSGIREEQYCAFLGGEL